MSEESEPTQRSDQFRSAIAAFIDARREAKLKDKEPDAKATSKYDYGGWLADAARRVGQIQAVTHVLKATHPDARGSSLHVTPARLPAHTEIGTHSLGAQFAEDVVGNAAALDVFKFLKLEVDGRRLLDWMQGGDADLLQALHTDPAIAAEWSGAFSGLVRAAAEPTSHEKAKQVYWLTGDSPADDTVYHLLQPLFSSSLAHTVHADIQDVRFGEESKLARQAFRDKKPHDVSYRDYRGLAVRKLGGTKPQNISQLNSERGGVNYLLASLPPRWERERQPRLLNVETALTQFGYFEGVRRLLKTLSDFLLSDPPTNTATREYREHIDQALSGQLMLYAASIRGRTEPGWTRHLDCKLPLCERLWLDPERILLPPREDPVDDDTAKQAAAKDDEAFIAAYHRGDWQDEVAARYANWVNERLREAGLSQVGDAEYKHWARQAIIDAAWPVPLQRRAGGGP
jgi:CRISPR-associated protein Csy1